MTVPEKPGGAPAPLVAPAPAAIADAYRGGMRLLAASVCLITSRRGDELGGMIATAVTSVSTAPPTLLICVNRSASLFEMVQDSASFCVNVLGAGALGLVEQFSNSKRRDERFRTGEWTMLPSGAPMCSEALVAFDCTVAKMVDWHTHGIFLGEVQAVLHPQAGARPLLYMDQAFHHLTALPPTC